MQEESSHPTPYYMHPRQKMLWQRELDSKLFGNHSWLSHLTKMLKWFLRKGQLLPNAQGLILP